MTYDPIIREKAIELRKQGYLYDDILKMLNVKNKSTLHYWLKDLDIPKKITDKVIESARNAARSSARKKAGFTYRNSCRLVRENNYNVGYNECKYLLYDSLFRDFIIIYLCEGFRKTKSRVSVSNSNHYIIKLSYNILKRFIDKKFYFRIQYHCDQDIEELKEFWANELDISINEIKVQRKSNSGEMNGRKWNSKYGVFSFEVASTELRCRLQGWMDYVMETWGYGRPEVSPYIAIYPVSDDSEFDEAS